MNSADLVAKYRFAPDRPLTMPTEGKSIQVAWDDFLVLADRIEALEARLAEAMETLRKERDEFRACLATASGKLMVAEAEQDRLREALRETDCPRPCNGRPDDFSAGDCFDAGECGCGVRAALQKEHQP